MIYAPYPVLPVLPGFRPPNLCRNIPYMVSLVKYGAILVYRGIGNPRHRIIRARGHVILMAYDGARHGTDYGQHATEYLTCEYIRLCGRCAMTMMAINIRYSQGRQVI